MTFLLDHDVPSDIEYSLVALGHAVVKLREIMPRTTPDEEIFRLAGDRGYVLITCNQDDFLALAGKIVPVGLVILIRRRRRAQERAALVRLLDNAGEAGLRGNINFA